MKTCKTYSYKDLFILVVISLVMALFLGGCSNASGGGGIVLVKVDQVGQFTFLTI